MLRQHVQKQTCNADTDSYRCKTHPMHLLASMLPLNLRQQRLQVKMLYQADVP